jgi:hypothetical protein
MTITIITIDTIPNTNRFGGHQGRTPTQIFKNASIIIRTPKMLGKGMGVGRRRKIVEIGIVNQDEFKGLVVGILRGNSLGFKAKAIKGGCLR